MAYTALVSLDQVLDQILHHDEDDLDRHKVRLLNLHGDILMLLNLHTNITKKAFKFDLEEEIIVAANRAEDIIEYHISNEIRSEFLNHPHKSGGLYSRRYNWARLYQELTFVMFQIDSILIKVKQIKSSSSSSDESEDLMSNHTPDFLSSVLDRKHTVVVGFEQDLIEIKGRLCGEPKSKLQIIPIFGMGGIGKTTLAKYAYDDPLTDHHFDVRVWVTISQNYSKRRILTVLLHAFDPSKKEQFEGMSDAWLEERVHKYLICRRYLIVLDDMWNFDEWDDLRRVFPDVMIGSRIIVTTREFNVASYVDFSRNPHRMHLMDVDQSWSLLKEKVFAHEDEDCSAELERIGMLIAENCRGLPLAIVVIAGVLSKVDRGEKTWANIARNVNEAVNTSGEPFSEILHLSYTHLPHHLRPCFLYMGSFPDDYEINVSRLIKLWAAEEEYVEDLAKRSLILVARNSANGRVKAVKIHDLLRDLCIRQSRDEKFLHVKNELSPHSSEGMQSLRRLSIFTNIWSGFPILYGSSIHTILLFQNGTLNSLRSFQLLRVLDTSSVVLTSYPVEVGELFHLRYLAFTFEYIGKGKFEVPASLSSLQNLQTLIIRHVGLAATTHTSYLPFGIWKMPQLRHLILFDGVLPDLSAETSCGILALEYLQTLTRVKSFRCSKRRLEAMPNLKKLGIFYSFSEIDETGWSKYGLSNLVHLHKLEKLNLYGKSFVALKKLTFSGCGLKWNEMTIVGSLPNLEVLKLKRHACDGFEWKTTEGGFCQLKLLVIDSTDLRVWITERCHFPKLERLVLYDCYKLEKIPFDIGEIPTLQAIEVDLRNSSVVNSAKCIAEEQLESYGNELQIRVLKSRTWRW
ncbi:hypothetical protein MIMGU_mgv1a001243mg [Erythranthe guttata]|uniref:Uncharacterized protein n=1 Tax=Erythranthe guttata TaxID=4155 RepID=A0A022Q689_ERYGU|nr:hypothetical protein MIMGU_mgv1a001243mg [Erythranthe guttata]